GGARHRAVDRPAGSNPRLHPPREVRRGEADGLRAGHLQETGSACPDHQAGRRRGVHGDATESAPAAGPRAGAHRGPRRVLPQQHAVPERRLLYGAHLRGDGAARRDVPGHVRDRADGRLAGPVAGDADRSRAEDRPSAPDLHRPGAPRLCPDGSPVMTVFAFDRAPLRVYWELTRACDLACRHCRANAIRDRAADELTTDECDAVLASLARATGPMPHVIFTGGDPLNRPDLVPLVRAAVSRGLPVSVAPSATHRLSRETIHAVAAPGVSAMSLSIDAPTAAYHDGLRGVLGCFGWTLAAAARIVAAGIPLQINTLVCAETEPHLEETAKLVARIGAARWSLFFLIDAGRGRALRGGPRRPLSRPSGGSRGTPAAGHSSPPRPRHRSTDASRSSSLVTRPR